MPYNNSAIPPTAEITGAATLPRKSSHCFKIIYIFRSFVQVARVKRILQVDNDISASSANATFAITIATV